MPFAYASGSDERWPPALMLRLGRSWMVRHLHPQALHENLLPKLPLLAHVSDRVPLVRGAAGAGLHPAVRMRTLRSALLALPPARPLAAVLLHAPSPGPLSGPYVRPGRPR